MGAMSLWLLLIVVLVACKHKASHCNVSQYWHTLDHSLSHSDRAGKVRVKVNKGPALSVLGSILYRLAITDVMLYIWIA